MTAQTQTPVRWGILGTARIATKVGNAIRGAKGADLIAVASRSLATAEEWASEHSASRSYGSYQELLEDPDIDAVYIPLPPAMHAEWTIRAAEHGKHVLCEKPLACSASDAQEMWSACRQHHVQLMDGVMWIHHPRANEMLAPIREGSLGTLRRVTSGFSFNWDVIPENDIRLQRDMGGGSLLDLGWYCIGATLWAFDSLPQRVFGTGRYYHDVDMTFSGLMWFDDERIASFDCAFDAQFRRWMEIAGATGSLVCDDFTKPWDESRPRFWINTGAGDSVEHVSNGSIQEVCMIEDFCDIVRSGTLVDHWPERSIAIQRVCDALDRSARECKIVELEM